MKQMFRNAFQRSVFNYGREVERTETAGSIVKSVGGHFKKNYNPRDPVFVKDEMEGRSINNLYTGYKLGGKGNLAVAGSLLGGGTLIVSNPRGYQGFMSTGDNVEAQSAELDVESLQSTRADSLGYKAQLSSAQQQLSASGDLVFAMHKTRHSGQF